MRCKTLWISHKTLTKTLPHGFFCFNAVVWQACQALKPRFCRYCVMIRTNRHWELALKNNLSIRLSFLVLILRAIWATKRSRFWCFLVKAPCISWLATNWLIFRNSCLPCFSSKHALLKLYLSFIKLILVLMVICQFMVEGKCKMIAPWPRWPSNLVRKNSRLPF